jgi:hypothetical protein
VSYLIWAGLVLFGSFLGSRRDQPGSHVRLVIGAALGLSVFGLLFIRRLRPLPGSKLYRECELLRDAERAGHHG